MGRRDAGIRGVELVVVGEGGVVSPSLGLRRAGVREPVEVLVVRAAGLGRLRRARRVRAGALGRLLHLEHRLLLVRVAASHHGVVLLDEGVHLEIIELVPHRARRSCAMRRERCRRRRARASLGVAATRSRARSSSFEISKLHEAQLVEGVHK